MLLFPCLITRIAEESSNSQATKGILNTCQKRHTETSIGIGCQHSDHYASRGRSALFYCAEAKAETPGLCPHPFTRLRAQLATTIHSLGGRANGDPCRTCHILQGHTLIWH